ncbi:MAG: flavoprotein, partial [Sulfurimonas sp.]
MNIPKNLLKNKKILLAVTGSIAIYKSLELVRHLVKAGAEVRVVMSDSAKKFVTPLTFET